MAVPQHKTCLPPSIMLGMPEAMPGVAARHRPTSRGRLSMPPFSVPWPVVPDWHVERARHAVLARAPASRVDRGEAGVLHARHAPHTVARLRVTHGHTNAGGSKGPPTRALFLWRLIMTCAIAPLVQDPRHQPRVFPGVVCERVPDHAVPGSQPPVPILKPLGPAAFVGVNA